MEAVLSLVYMLRVHTQRRIFRKKKLVYRLLAWLRESKKQEGQNVVVVLTEEKKEDTRVNKANKAF